MVVPDLGTMWRAGPDRSPRTPRGAPWRTGAAASAEANFPPAPGFLTRPSNLWCPQEQHRPIAPRNVRVGSTAVRLRILHPIIHFIIQGVIHLDLDLAKVILTIKLFDRCSNHRKIIRNTLNQKCVHLLSAIVIAINFKLNYSV